MCSVQAPLPDNPPGRNKVTQIPISFAVESLQCEMLSLIMSVSNQSHSWCGTDYIVISPWDWFPTNVHCYLEDIQ